MDVVAEDFAAALKVVDPVAASPEEEVVFVAGLLVAVAQEEEVFVGEDLEEVASHPPTCFAGSMRTATACSIQPNHKVQLVSFCNESPEPCRESIWRNRSRLKNSLKRSIGCDSSVSQAAEITIRAEVLREVPVPPLNR